MGPGLRRDDAEIAPRLRSSRRRAIVASAVAQKNLTALSIRLRPDRL
jgi:hypothetical protein